MAKAKPFKSAHNFFMVLALGLLPLITHATNLQLPNPTVMSGITSNDSVPERRRHIKVFIQNYVNEYAKAFMKINNVNENRFNTAQIASDLNAIYEKKRDAQVMSVGEADVLFIKSRMDEVAAKLYLQAEIVNRLGPQALNSTVYELIASLRNDLTKLRDSVNSWGRSSLAIKEEVSRLEKRIDQMDAKIRGLGAPSSTLATSPSATLAPSAKGAEFYISIAALIIALGGFILNRLGRN